jgi:hypothetical protein
MPIDLDELANRVFFEGGFTRRLDRVPTGDDSIVFTGPLALFERRQGLLYSGEVVVEEKDGSLEFDLDGQHQIDIPLPTGATLAEQDAISFTYMTQPRKGQQFRPLAVDEYQLDSLKLPTGDAQPARSGALPARGGPPIQDPPHPPGQDPPPVDHLPPAVPEGYVPLVALEAAEAPPHFTKGVTGWEEHGAYRLPIFEGPLVSTTRIADLFVDPTITSRGRNDRERKKVKTMLEERPEYQAAVNIDGSLITNPRATRRYVPVEDARSLLMHALEHGSGVVEGYFGNVFAQDVLPEKKDPSPPGQDPPPPPPGQDPPPAPMGEGKQTKGSEKIIRYNGFVQHNGVLVPRMETTIIPIFALANYCVDPELPTGTKRSSRRQDLRQRAYDASIEVVNAFGHVLEPKNRGKNIMSCIATRNISVTLEAMLSAGGAVYRGKAYARKGMGDEDETIPQGWVEQDDDLFPNPTEVVVPYKDIARLFIDPDGEEGVSSGAIRAQAKNNGYAEKLVDSSGVVFGADAPRGKTEFIKKDDALGLIDLLRGKDYAYFGEKYAALDAANGGVLLPTARDAPPPLKQDLPPPLPPPGQDPPAADKVTPDGWYLAEDLLLPTVTDERVRVAAVYDLFRAPDVDGKERRKGRKRCTGFVNDSQELSDLVTDEDGNKIAEGEQKSKYLAREHIETIVRYLIGNGRTYHGEALAAHPNYAFGGTVECGTQAAKGGGKGENRSPPKQDPSTGGGSDRRSAPPAKPLGPETPILLPDQTGPVQWHSYRGIQVPLVMEPIVPLYELVKLFVRPGTEGWGIKTQEDTFKSWLKESGFWNKLIEPFGRKEGIQEGNHGQQYFNGVDAKEMLLAAIDDRQGYFGNAFAQNLVGAGKVPWGWEEERAWVLPVVRDALMPLAELYRLFVGPKEHRDAEIVHRGVERGMEPPLNRYQWWGEGPHAKRDPRGRRYTTNEEALRIFDELTVKGVQYFGDPTTLEKLAAEDAAVKASRGPGPSAPASSAPTKRSRDSVDNGALPANWILDGDTYVPHYSSGYVALAQVFRHFVAQSGRKQKKTKGNDKNKLKEWMRTGGRKYDRQRVTKGGDNWNSVQTGSGDQPYVSAATANDMVAKLRDDPQWGPKYHGHKDCEQIMVSMARAQTK